MKKTIILSFIAIALWSCSKQTLKPPPNLAVQSSALADRPILFIGSSTTAQWNLDTSFVGYNTTKNAKGGYTYGRMRAYFNWDSLIALNPKQLIVQGGDNDVYEKRKLAYIQADCQWIIDRFMTAIPDIQVVFLYAKPTALNKEIIYPTGENGWQITEYFNRNMNYWGKQKYLTRFLSVDTYMPMLLWNPKRLNTVLYKSDGVHLSSKGYYTWNTRLRPLLIK